MIVLIIAVNLLEYLINDPQSSFQIQDFIVVVILCFHQLNAILQQFNLSLLQPQLILILSYIFEKIQIVRCAALFAKFTVLKFFLQPLNLFPCYHFIVTLFRFFPQSCNFSFITLLYSTNVILFSNEPKLIQFKESFFDAVLTHLFILQFHLQHYLITRCRRPKQFFIYFDLTTAACPLPLYLLIQTTTFQPFHNVLEVVRLFKIINEMIYFFILLCASEQSSQSINCLFGLFQLQQLCTFGFFSHIDLIHGALQLSNFLFQHFVNSIQVFNFAVVILLIQLQRFDFEKQTAYLLLFVLQLTFQLGNLSILLLLLLILLLLPRESHFAFYLTELSLQPVNFFFLFTADFINFKFKKFTLLLCFAKLFKEKNVILPSFSVLFFCKGNSRLQIFLLFDLNGFLHRVVRLFAGLFINILPLNGLFDLLVIFKQFMIALKFLLVVLI